MTSCLSCLLTFLLFCFEGTLGFIGYRYPSLFPKISLVRKATSNNGDWDELLRDFSGDFDNYNQVVEDRSKGLLPREGGGHEHVHCTLLPLSPTTRLAAFYFDGLPQRIFRFRFYELLPSNDQAFVDMKLYTLHPTLEESLRATEDPTEWPQLFQDFQEEYKDEQIVQELLKCDVRWSREMDPVQHCYAKEQFPNLKGHHAVMVYGEALVDSTMIPGTKILIRDQLSLWQDEFWIHDRGYDPDTMNFIYGNQRGVPYQLKRVTKMKGNGREVVNEELKWTLGPTWRTPEEYDTRMQSLGGASSKLNTPPKRDSD